MIVAALVLYAGLTSLVESVKKIIHPEAAEYSAVSLVIIAVAILVKLGLGTYVKRQGQRVNSGALAASGSDALFDAILSASVLASAVVYLLWGVSLEAYVGVAISLFILKAGVEMMIETLNDIIGKREDAETTKELKRIVCQEEGVLGAYDVTLFNYGPDKNYGSVHIELPDTLTMDEVDRMTRRIQADVFQRTGVILTGIGLFLQLLRRRGGPNAQRRPEDGPRSRLGPADARLLRRHGEEGPSLRRGHELRRGPEGGSGDPLWGGQRPVS